VAPWCDSAGLLTGTVLLLVAYALLPESLRFSRAILLLGTGWMAAVTFGIRSLCFGWHWQRRRGLNRLIVAEPEEAARILAVVRSRGEEGQEPLALSPRFDEVRSVPVAGDLRYVGGLGDLSEGIRVHRVDEVIFSGRDVSAADIIAAMATAVDSGTTFRIAWSDGGAWVGPGGPLSDPLFGLQRAIHLPTGRREKRMFDVVTAGALLLGLPMLVLSGRSAWIPLAARVLRGKATWVGFARPGAGLPAFKPAVLRRAAGEEERVANRLDLHYARDYRWLTDLRVVFHALLSHPRMLRHGHH